MGRKPKANARDYGVLSKLAYKKHAGEIQKGLPQGYQLDEANSTRETKVYYNPETKKAVVAYRGTDLRDPKRFFKDLKSDFNIAIGKESKDKRFKEAEREFKKISHKYKGMGYSLDTTGHSLGGQIANHVNKTHKGEVEENLSFSRGSGIMEPFRKRPKNSYDFSHKRDLISLGARLSKDEGGGRNNSVVSGTKVKNGLQAHSLDRLEYKHPEKKKEEVEMQQRIKRHRPSMNHQVSAPALKSATKLPPPPNFVGAPISTGYGFRMPPHPPSMHALMMPPPY
jgi:hypothetical protein